MTAEMKKGHRIEWIDFAKGITILLVIIGHCVHTNFFGNLARGLIFSFHMPLFFIVSCATAKWSDSMEVFRKRFKKSAIHLLIPLLACYVILTIYYCIKDPSLLLNLSWWKGRVYTLIIGSGIRSEFAGMEIAALGAGWFMFALLIGRTIFDYLHMKLAGGKLLIASILFGIAGILLGQFWQLPFSFDIALAIMPFLYFGSRLTEIDLKKHAIGRLFLSLAIWLVTLYLTWPNVYHWTYLELAARTYPLFPLCFVSAIAGSLFILQLSEFCCRLGKVSRPLVLLGKNSLYLYMVHMIDSIWEPLFYVEGHQFLTSLLRLLCDLIGFGIFMTVRYVIIILRRNRTEKGSRPDGN